MDKKDQAADRRLQKKYGITLAEYNEMLAAQNGVCKICGRPPVNYRLSVDHDHRFERIKIKVYKISQWIAEASITFIEGLTSVVVHGESRLEVGNEIRLILRRKSLRGLLCMSCNKGLQYYRDIPERFEAAARYLREYNDKLGIRK